MLIRIVVIFAMQLLLYLGAFQALRLIMFKEDHEYRMVSRFFRFVLLYIVFYVIFLAHISVIEKVTDIVSISYILITLNFLSLLFFICNLCFLFELLIKYDEKLVYFFEVKNICLSSIFYFLFFGLLIFLIKVVIPYIIIGDEIVVIQKYSSYSLIKVIGFSIFEEYYFRYFLLFYILLTFKIDTTSRGNFFIFIIISMIFVVSHLDQYWVFRFVSSLIYFYCQKKCKNIIFPMMLHIFSNLIVYFNVYG